jgi:hypothetical protein
VDAPSEGFFGISLEVRISVPMPIPIGSMIFRTGATSRPAAPIPPTIADPHPSTERTRDREGFNGFEMTLTPLTLRCVMSTLAKFKRNHLATRRSLY